MNDINVASLVTTTPEETPFEGTFLQAESGRYVALINDPDKLLDVLSVCQVHMTKRNGEEQVGHSRILRRAHEKLPGEWIGNYRIDHVNPEIRDEYVRSQVIPKRDYQIACELAEEVGLDLDAVPPKSVRQSIGMYAETPLRRVLIAQARENELFHTLRYLKRLSQAQEDSQQVATANA